MQARDPGTMQQEDVCEVQIGLHDAGNGTLANVSIIVTHDVMNHVSSLHGRPSPQEAEHH